MRLTRGKGKAAVAATLALALFCTGCAGGAQSAANGSDNQNAATTNVATNASDVQNDGAANSNDNAAIANANVNANGNTTVIIDGDAKDAQGTLPDGWYQAALTADGDGSTPAFTAVTVDGDQWTLTGTATKALEEDALQDSQSQVGPGVWTLTLSSDVVLEASGGDAGSQSLDRATFEDVMSQLNGLGLVLHVEDNMITYACLAS